MSKRLFVAVVYWLFVVYGSLVPLEYRPIPFDEALEQFRNIRYLSLGIASRADWIANILLYMPLSVSLLLVVEPPKTNGLVKTILTTSVVAFCLSSALVIEFVQQYFPPRTVSLNDLIAETLGTILGVIVWSAMGGKALAYWRQLSFGNWLSVNAAIALYLPAYLFLSLFPFDFVTSYAELESKLNSGGDSLWIDLSYCHGDLIKCLVKWVVEIMVLVPLGVLFGALRFAPNRMALAIASGFLLGFVIEVVQLFIYSANAQGFSVLTRMIGMAVGVFVFDRVSSMDFSLQVRQLRLLSLPVFLVYLAIWLFVNGWFVEDWLSLAQAQSKLNETRFLPFFYFYYTTETVALVSLMSNVGGYLPVGILGWLLNADRRAENKWPAIWVGMSAALLAVVLEAGKLFLASKHADPTDILIAYVAAAMVYQGLNALQTMMQQPASIKTAVALSASVDLISARTYRPRSSVRPVVSTHPIRWFVAVSLSLAVLYGVTNYPLQPLILGFSLAAYAWGLFRQPRLGAFLIPALLPVMDFAPWSGRFFLDEFDFLILTTLAMTTLLPHSVAMSSKRHDIRDVLIIASFFLMLTISLWLGMLPMPDIDHNAFSNYYSNFNALRVAKGFFAALALMPYWLWVFSDDEGRRYFSNGTMLGVFALGVFALIERAVFPGLWDFSTDYRINALFASMHNGGGHIESYLMLSMPLIATAFLKTSQVNMPRIFGLMVFALGFHALMVSFSRGGAIGFLIAFLVFLMGFWWHARARGLVSGQTYRWLIVIVSIVMALAVPVFRGELMQARLGVSDRDKASRQHHWRTAIDMMDSGLGTQLFGMGLGSFPRTFFWSNQENTHPATYRIELDNGNPYLALRGGDALFLGQYVNLAPHRDYLLTMKVRTPEGSASLSVPVCEKSLQYSFRCVSVDINAKPGEWQSVEKSFNSGEVGALLPSIAFGLLARPVQLAFYAGGRLGQVIEIDDVSLTATDAPGNHLIVNGDFSAGIDRWYFSTEKHNPWHIFNIWVHVLFDMGWIGLLTFVLLVVYVYYRLIKALKSDVYAPMLMASFTGFLVVGVVDSPFDAPRLSFLFSVLLIFAIFGCKRSARIFNQLNND